MTGERHVAKKRASTDSDLYPNSPLSEVAFEVRFAGEPSVEARRHEFYEQIRKEYPDVLVPHAKEGVAQALTGYRFCHEESGAKVAIAINSFAYLESDYRGHTKFIFEVAHLYDLLTSLVPIRRITRVGWRYVNAIPFTREDGYVPLSRFLREVPAVLSGFAGEYKKINFRASTHYKGTDAGIRLESALNGGTDDEVLVFDIDMFKTFDKADKQPNVTRMAEQLRKAGREVFEDSITEAYREFLKGKAYD